jgi:PST family polysaccharide transporter
MAESRRMAANLSFTFAARAAELLAGLILVGMLSRYLGLEDFGRYSVLMAIGWVALPLLNLGFPRILVREIAQRRERAAGHILLGWTWNLLLTLLTAAGLLGVSSFTDLPDVKLLLIIAATTGVMAMTQTAGTVSIALQRMQYETIPALITAFVLISLVALVMRWQLGLEAVFTANALACLTGLLATIWLTNKLSPYLRELPRQISTLRHTKELLRESVQIGLFQLLVQLHLYTGVFLLKAMAGNAEAALFQAPFRIFTRVQIIPMTFMPVLLPIFSRLFFAENRDELRQTSQAVFRFMLLICLLLTFFAAAVADQIIPLILGPDFKASAQVFRILSLSICFSFLNTLFDAFFIAAKRVSAMGWVQAAGVLLCGAGNLLLIPHYASLGSSWAIVLSSGLMFAVNWLLFRDLLPAMLTKTVLTLTIGGAAGTAAAAMVQNYGIIQPLLFGVLVCAGAGFLLRLVSLDDLSRLRWQ